MPKPSRLESANVAMVLMDAYHRLVLETAKKRDEMARILIEEADLSDAEMEHMIADYEVVQSKVELFGHSALALEMARRSIS